MLQLMRFRALVLVSVASILGALCNVDAHARSVQVNGVVTASSDDTVCIPESSGPITTATTPPPGIGILRTHGQGTASGQLEAPVRGAPYSAVGITSTVQRLADGTQVTHREVAHLFRDSRGRTRVELQFSFVGPFSLATPVDLIIITDPVARRRFILHPATHRAESLLAGSLSGPNAGSEPAAADTGPVLRDCAPQVPASSQVQSLGTKLIAGLKASGSRREVTIPAGEMGNDKPITITSEEWVSTDLHVVLSRTRSDPLNGNTTYVLEGIKRADPDPKLFNMPAGYAVQKMPEADMPVVITPH